jgi:putative nucleotidyltransferase with HDIG domain
VVEFLRAGMHSSDFQPPLLPATAMQLFELSRDPDVDLSRIRALIEQDPVIAAKVMSTAQSAFYSRGMPIESIDDAIVRLGVKRLTGIFLEASMRVAVIGSKAFEKPLEQLRRHGVATGHIARGLCQTLKLPPDRAFVCGLLHDIGIAACYMLLSRMPKGERPKQFETVSRAVRQVHEQASAVMAEKWKLPYGIRWVVGNHHALAVGGHTNPMTAIVSLADWLASVSGADALGEADEQLARSAARHFRIADDELTRLVERSKKLIEQLS